MNVLFFCSSIPSKGIHYYTATLPLEIKCDDVDVVIVSSPGEADKGIRSMVNKAGLEVHDLPGTEDKHLPSMLRSSMWYARLFKKYRIDLLHVYGFATAFRCLVAQWLFFRKQKIPIIVSLEALRHGKKTEMLARAIASFVFNHTFCKVCLLSSTEVDKMEKAGLACGNYVQIPNWIDPDLFGTAPKAALGRLGFEDRLDGRRVVTYLANLHPRKGHIDLLSAVERVVKVFPDSVFVFAGEGSIEYELKRMAEQRKVIENIVFSGRLSPDEVGLLLGHTDIGVVASLSETFGWAIIEPLLAGKPVVTTDVGFGPDVGRAGGALVVPQRNPKAMADALIRLMSNPELGRQIAKKGKAFVLDQCSINNVAGQYRTLYRELMQARKICVS